MSTDLHAQKPPARLLQQARRKFACAGKSRFLPTEGGQKFADEVIAKAATPRLVKKHGGGRLIFEVADLGRVVGFDRSGHNKVKGGVVVVQIAPPDPYWDYNEVITQYPK